VKGERSESHALTVLHVKCEEVAQEVRAMHPVRLPRAVRKMLFSALCGAGLKKEKIKLGKGRPLRGTTCFDRESCKQVQHPPSPPPPSRRH